MVFRCLFLFFFFFPFISRGGRGGPTNNNQDCVTRLRGQARTLPYKACAGHCYVGEAKVRLRIREHWQQISCSEILHLFSESDWNRQQQDWLGMATIQEGTVSFCATYVLVSVFSWIITTLTRGMLVLFTEQFAYFFFSLMDIPVLDIDQIVPSQASHVYRICRSNTQNSRNTFSFFIFVT